MREANVSTFLWRRFRTMGSRRGEAPAPSPADAEDQQTLALVEALLRSRQELLGAVPTCSLAQYREFVRHLPRPSEAQIDDFVQFVSEDHSWYKKLPLLPPGERFQFFLDPLAGFTRLIQPAAGVEALERKVPGGNWTFTTEEYRSRFGHLACDRAAGIRLVDLGHGPHGEYGECDIFCAGDSAYRIPVEISEIGSAEVTAVIHPLTARVWVWYRFLPEFAGRSWPSETGDDSTLQQIREICARARRFTDEISEELDALLLAERRRLHSQMRDAIRRMLDRI